MNDLISRQAAIVVLDIGRELLRRALDDTDVVGVERAKYEWGLGLIKSYIFDMKALPSAQPEPSIPISWIEKQIDWLKSMDNEFSNITAMNISALVKRWRKENGKDERFD